MQKFLLSLIGFFFCIGLGIMVMIFGWGLTPVSWGWIVGGGITSSFFGAIFSVSN